MPKALEIPRIKQSLDFTCGAACFESMFRYFRGESLGEIHFAKELGTLEIGYTPVEKIHELATAYGFQSLLLKGGKLNDLRSAVARDDVVFVTWWDEDAGHYSLVKSISDTQITLMDPWEAREGKDKTLLLIDFLDYWNQRGSVLIGVSDFNGSAEKAER